MNTAEKTALVCDYLRSTKGEAPERIDYAITFENIFEPKRSAALAAEFLDNVEALSFYTIGSMIVERLVEHHLEAAMQWRDERRNAA